MINICSKKSSDYFTFWFLVFFLNSSFFLLFFVFVATTVQIKIVELLFRYLEDQIQELSSMHNAGLISSGIDGADVEFHHDSGERKRKRVDEIRSWIGILKRFNFQNPSTCQIGSIVRLLEDNREVLIFILPFGGFSLKTPERQVIVVSSSAPKAQFLLGKPVGYSYSFRRQNGEIVGLY